MTGSYPSMDRHVGAIIPWSTLENGALESSKSMSNPQQISVPKNDFIDYEKVTIIGKNKTIYNKLILIRLEYDISKKTKIGKDQN